jgi:D-arabinono-1,4-lactone oxidase/FAD binding domain-containing protein
VSSAPFRSPVPEVPRLTFSLRRKWNNHTGNQGVDPLRIYTPESLEDLVDLVQAAESEGVTIRAVGSGHSWSDVALTTGYLIRPERLARPLNLEAEPLRPGVDVGRMAQVEAGMRIRKLNALLESRGQALANMGGYDGQTVAGVISTSTHGSGLDYGPLSDIVLSMDVVGSGAKIYRIEPAAGPTERRAYEAAHPDRTLVQDDHWFAAVRVGMGCLGVIYSVMLDVVPSYWLKEVRTVRPWSAVKDDLLRGDVLRNIDHYELIFNPYPRGGDRRCLVTTRTRVPPSPDLKPDRRRRRLLPELLAHIPFIPALENAVIGIWPQLAPRFVDTAVGALADKDYTNVSYKVLNIGAANYLPAYSAEIAVPVDERARHIKAVECIFEVADRWRRLGEIYETAPIALRFVKGSTAYMSMMYGGTTMMIELIQASHTEGGFELQRAYEDALYRLGGRPHWGQVNSLNRGLVAAMYPDSFDRWLDVHGKLNHSGVFDSPFSRRIGIAKEAFERW